MDPYDKEKTRQIWKRVLGEEDSEDGCAFDSERLRAMIEREKTSACNYAALARCAGGRCCEALRRLSQEESCHAKQLETVFFLWTGEPSCAAAGPLMKFRCIAEALRELHQQEMEAAKQYRRTAEELPEFRDLFLQLATDETRHAGQLRCLLQNYV